MPVGRRAGRQPHRSLKLMLANYAQIVRRSVLTTAAVGVVMIIVSGSVSGVKGLVGAVLGAALVAVFFAISVFPSGPAARPGPQPVLVTVRTTSPHQFLL